MIRNENVPEELLPVINKWNEQGKEYYLGPDNIFLYKHHKITYHGGQGIPLKGWFASNGGIRNGYQLTKSDIEEIQKELLQYMEITRWTLCLDWRCNYQCTMCPYHGDEKEVYYETMQGEYNRSVTREEAYERVDKLAEQGIKILSIMSQGEILLYPYWKDVSKYAHERGMELWTITNGSLWTEDTVKEAKTLGYTNVRVSLDALSYSTYAKIRSEKKEYYERAMNLPELLKKYGIITNVHFVKQKENLHEVKPFLEYWMKKEVDSISIANEFYYDGEVVVNRFVQNDKEYIDGLCTAFGNMETSTTGDTRFCCGMDAQRGDKFRNLEKYSCQAIIDEAKEQMRTDNSDLRKYCHKCALYVPYNDEEVVDGWKVVRNSERETWIKVM